MIIRVVLFLTLALIALGCATMRDALEGRESGTSRIVDAPFDSTWDAVVDVMAHRPTAEFDQTRGVLVTDWVERFVDPAILQRPGDSQGARQMDGRSDAA